MRARQCWRGWTVTGHIRASHISTEHLTCGSPESLHHAADGTSLSIRRCTATTEKNHKWINAVIPRYFNDNNDAEIKYFKWFINNLITQGTFSNHWDKKNPANAKKNMRQRHMFEGPVRMKSKFTDLSNWHKVSRQCFIHTRQKVWPVLCSRIFD